MISVMEKPTGNGGGGGGLDTIRASNSLVIRKLAGLCFRKKTKGFFLDNNQL